MKRFIALCCALALSMPALAQAPAALDPALTQSVRELLIEMKYREQLTARLQQAGQVMPQSIAKSLTERVNANTKLTDEQKKAELAIVTSDGQRVAQEGQRALADPKLVDEIFERIVPLYAGRFTQAEVNELLAFYKSPVAAKMQATIPQVMQEANRLTQEVVRERLMAILQGKRRK